MIALVCFVVLFLRIHLPHNNRDRYFPHGAQALWGCVGPCSRVWGPTRGGLLPPFSIFLFLLSLGPSRPWVVLPNMLTLLTSLYPEHIFGPPFLVGASLPFLFRRTSFGMAFVVMFPSLP